MKRVLVIVYTLLLCIKSDAYALNAILFEDNFENDWIGDSWVIPENRQTTVRIYKNKLIAKSEPNAKNYLTYIKHGFWWKNYKIFMKVSHVSGYYRQTSVDIHFRVQPTLTSNPNSSYGRAGYFFQLHGNGDVNLYRIERDSSLTLLSNVKSVINPPNKDGYNIEIDAIDERLSLFIDGNLIISARDNTYSHGSVGFASVHMESGIERVKIEGIGLTKEEAEIANRKLTEIRVANEQKAREIQRKLEEEEARRRAEAKRRAEEEARRRAELISKLEKLDVGDFVCSLRYTNGSGWCGVVEDIRGEKIRVEISEIIIKPKILQYFNPSIGPSECSGNKSLLYSSKGTLIWVPKLCIDEVR